MAFRRFMLRRHHVWPVLFAAMIFFASSRSRTVDIGAVPQSDKMVHFAVYGLLWTLVCRLGRGWRAGAVSLLIVSAFGASDEWHQSFVPGRFSDAADWLADTTGAALGIWLYTVWSRYRAWLETPLWRHVVSAPPETTGAPTTLAGQ